MCASYKWINIVITVLVYCPQYHGINHNIIPLLKIIFCHYATEVAHIIAQLLKICNIATVNTADNNKRNYMAHSSSNNKNSRHHGCQGWGSHQGRGSCQGHVGGPVNLQQQQQHCEQSACGRASQSAEASSHPSTRTTTEGGSIAKKCRLQTFRPRF